jgi:hypothetical protein
MPSAAPLPLCIPRSLSWISRHFQLNYYATVTPSDPANLDANLVYLYSRGNTHPLLINAVHTALTNLQPAVTSSQVFTDDHAPIEWITNSMIMDFFLSGDVEKLE